MGQYLTMSIMAIPLTGSFGTCTHRSHLWSHISHVGLGVNFMLPAQIIKSGVPVCAFTMALRDILVLDLKVMDLRPTVNKTQMLLTKGP